jgi:adenine-specific DNA-methyltransferase
MSKSPKSKPPAEKAVEALTYPEAKRKNIPTAEYQAMLAANAPVQVAYERRNRDLDPQLVWRGKDEQDAKDLVVNAPPLYIQEKVHPKALVDDLLRQTREKKHDRGELMADLFSDFNGIPKDADKTEFYQHDQNWTNRMILGDSLQVMASLAEREGLRGKVQCIYFDPPYGIRFNSNFQWSTTNSKATDGKLDHITREPEQVKAFRDTWRDGIHSYLTYLRDRLSIAHELLHESGSIFLQIGDENVHVARMLLEEVFGSDNFVAQVSVEKTSAQTSEYLSMSADYVLMFARDKAHVKFRPLLSDKIPTDSVITEYSNFEDDQLRRGSIEKSLSPDEWRDQERTLKLFSKDTTTSSRPPGTFPVAFRGKSFTPGNGFWKTGETGFSRLIRANRIEPRGASLRYVRFFRDYRVSPINNIWRDVRFSSRREEKVYVVQSSILLAQRCILMATDPADLVLDPTCGSGTIAAAAEQWGRRWITIDTSRVALALARARIMGARYSSYLLADSREGQLKEAELTRSAPSEAPTASNIRHGFVYERVPHVTLKSIANNTEIDVIWEQYQLTLEPLRASFNKALKKNWEEWEIPRDADDKWPASAKDAHAKWWETRIARQREIDASIAAKADVEYLYDRPYEDRKKVRVAGPFTVESLSPHRMIGTDDTGAPIDAVMERKTGYTVGRDFPSMILENLRSAGVQQAAKADRITFTTLTPWPGELICADGRYLEGAAEKRAAIFIGPEFGTVARPDLVSAAREAAESGFDVLIACAFNFEAHTTEFAKLGKIPVLKARMNADLHMAEDLKKTDKANLFVVFGEPDITVTDAGSGRIQVKVNGVDVFDPSTGEVRSDGADGIACWFVDTDYNEESFFVRQAYFLGANDPYKALKTTLKAEVDADAWASLNSDTSRPFTRPASGRIAVKVINHLGDEVMKVFRV